MMKTGFKEFVWLAFNHVKSTFLSANNVMILPDNSWNPQNRVMKNVISTATNNFFRSSKVALNIIKARYRSTPIPMAIKRTFTMFLSHIKLFESHPT